MRKAKDPKDAKEPKPKVRAEKEPIEEIALPAVPESDAARARREARAEGFKALGDPIRLAICEYLAACAPCEQTAGAVCRAVTGDKKITAKVSHHLKELRRAGLIAMRKNGKNVLCALDASGAESLAAYLSAWTAQSANGRKTPGETKTKEASKTDDGANNTTELLDENPRADERLANAA